MKRKTTIAVNEQGRRIGQSHPRAKLTDHEVDLIRELIEGGMPLREIAKKFEDDQGRRPSIGHLSDIGRYKYRAQTPAELRSVDEPEPAQDHAHADREARPLLP